jgi:hypothetical protein
MSRKHKQPSSVPLGVAAQVPEEMRHSILDSQRAFKSYYGPAKRVCKIKLNGKWFDYSKSPLRYDRVSESEQTSFGYDRAKDTLTWWITNQPTVSAIKYWRMLNRFDSKLKIRSIMPLVRLEDESISHVITIGISRCTDSGKIVSLPSGERIQVNLPDKRSPSTGGIHQECFVRMLREGGKHQ